MTDHSSSSHGEDRPDVDTEASANLPVASSSSSSSAGSMRKTAQEKLNETLEAGAAKGMRRAITQFNPIIFRMLLKSRSDVEVWNLYRDEVGSPKSKTALEELFRRHGGIMHKFAQTMLLRYGTVATYNDFLQNANEGAMLAYSHFNPLRAAQSKTKLSSFVHKIVDQHSRRCFENQNSIPCPDKKRAMRSYLCGGFDSDLAAKQAFEKANGLTSVEAIEEARRTHALLAPNAVILDSDRSVNDDGDKISLEDAIRDENSLTQTQIAAKIDLDMVIARLNPRQQRVYDLIRCQECTSPETASILGVKESQVRSDLRAIDTALSRYARQQLEEEALIG